MFVRWQNLTLDADEAARLPGYRDEAIVRRFDAPEALETRFYEVRARSVLNRVPRASRMPFRWTINPYRGCAHACVYCFARPTHRYLDFDAGRDFEREIVVKVNAPEVLRVELARPSWRREHVALGTNTDPYQWVEGRYQLMPGIWEALRDAANPCSVLTKSPLLLRDLPLMRQIAARTEFTAALSIPTLDERAWRATEPHTPNPRARLEAVAELNRQGIPTGILIAPLMPGINDAPEQLEPLMELAAEAGAVSIGGIALHLRSDVRRIFMDWLRATRPDLVPRYERLYARGAYAPRAERERLARLVRGRVRRQPAWRLRTRERPAAPAPAPGAPSAPGRRTRAAGQRSLSVSRAGARAATGAGLREAGAAGAGAGGGPGEAGTRRAATGAGLREAGAARTRAAGGPPGTGARTGAADARRPARSAAEIAPGGRPGRGSPDPGGGQQALF